MKTMSMECPHAAACGAEALGVTAARLAAGLEQRIEQFVGTQDQNLGHLETQVAQQALCWPAERQATETGAQQKADAVPPRCPQCQRALTRLAPGHPRTFATRFGEITVRRTRGYGPRCQKWRVPADATGLEDTAGYSPAVQEMTALLASKMPVGEASLVIERLTGVKVPRATLDREARRQGGRAQALRRTIDAQPVAAPTPPRQLAEHRRKNTKAGQQLGEFALIHTEAFDSFREGRAREVFLKSGAGRAWLNQRYSRPANRPPQIHEFLNQLVISESVHCPPSTESNFLCHKKAQKSFCR